MMDESVAPSNTPPCNAVYDGNNYYYLPWSREKPCVCVESYWENIAFRLEPLNALLRIIDRLVSAYMYLALQGVALTRDFKNRPDNINNFLFKIFITRKTK